MKTELHDPAGQLAYYQGKLQECNDILRNLRECETHSFSFTFMMENRTVARFTADNPQDIDVLLAFFMALHSRYTFLIKQCQHIEVMDEHFGGVF